MRTAIGGFFKIVGGILWAIFGIWRFLVSLVIVNDATGFWGVVIAFVFFPVTFAAAPWYAVVAHGNWFPLLICYGGIIVASVFFGIGTAIAGD